MQKTHSPPAPAPSGRGTALVVVIATLIVVTLVVAGVITAQSREAELQRFRTDSSRMDQAVDAAMQMALKEIYTGTDDDGDGTVGSISDNSNPADDPTVNYAKVYVTRTDSGTTSTLTAIATGAYGTRREQCVITRPYQNKSVAFFRDANNKQVQSSFRDASTYTWSTPALSGTTHEAPTWVVAKGTKLGSNSTIVGVQTKDKYLAIGLADPSTGVATYTTVTQDTGQGDCPCQRAFDIGIEQISGRALVAFYDNKTSKKLQYCTYDGSLSAAANTGATTTNVDWVTLTSRPNSNELLCMFLDDGKTVQVQTWSGTAWGAATKLQDKVDSEQYECYAGAYQQVSENPIIVYCDDKNALFYRKFSGGAWGAETQIADIGNKPRWVHMAPRPGTNEVFCAIGRDDQKIARTRWSGSAWDAVQTTAGKSGFKDRRMFDIACSPDGTTVVFVYDQNASNFVYRTYSAGAWGAETAGPSTGSKVMIVQLVGGPGQADVLGGVSNDSNGIYGYRWNGSAFANVLQIKSDASNKDQCQRWYIDPGFEKTVIQSWSQITP